MAITALNNYSISDVNFNTMMTSLDKTFKGKADITISEYHTTSAPVIKVGSVFENNGSLFIVETADYDPVATYAALTNSTTFYLYYDESAGTFIYSNTAPTWSDALQGWYNGNDRAFFSMYKDSGGTLYSGKSKLMNSAILQTKVIPLGEWDMDTTATKAIYHGMTHIQIRNVTAIIQQDSNTNSRMLTFCDNSGVNQGWIETITDTSLSLGRLGTGSFDSALYNATSFNRGWVTIQYVE